MTPRLERFNALGRGEAQERLRDCCGSSEWARRMAGERPFRDLEDLLETADRTWRGLAREEWLEAFRAHPRIGDHSASGRAEKEQSGTRSAPAQILAALAAANRRYEKRFGHIFIVCAAGKSAAEMLALLQARLGNDPGTELAVAAEEQRKITRLRLQELFEP
ncbi:MAG: 2-oxo-4-hydroxy-4-carboxy-5-ureidoimidazoline decarboxylase [Thermoanaerobaculia bacterium]